MPALLAPPVPSRVALALTDIMVRDGLTLAALAARIGVPRSTVRKWRTGCTPPTKPSHLRALAEALGWSVTHLVAGIAEDAALRAGEALPRAEREVLRRAGGRTKGARDLRPRKQGGGRKKKESP